MVGWNGPAVAGRILAGLRDGSEGFRIIVVTASAGGLTPLFDILAALPADIDAAIFVVVHMRPGYHSQLPLLISRRTRLPAVHAVDGQLMIPGRVVVAPPDGCHMVLEGDRVRLIPGAKEHHTRPAADPLFRSAAKYGRRTVAVILSGLGRDGADGAAEIKAAGGTVIVQDPDAAAHRPMPESAWAAASLVDSSDGDIAAALINLAGRRHHHHKG
jgi:two-component system chemotaxis response regulator CheB